jgi:hypothetical protein
MTVAAADRERMARALELVALVEESWLSARMTQENRQRYAADVMHLDPDEAEAAVEVLKRSGREFPPSAGDVAREVARLQIDAPEWGEVKRQLVQRYEATIAARSTADSWACPHDSCDGSGFVWHAERNDSTDCDCRPAKIAAGRAAATLHPLLREFIEDGYVTWSEVEAVGFGMQTTLESQMRTKWEAFAGRAVESRVIAALEGPPTLKRLGGARSEDAPRQLEDGRRRGELAKPDVLAALNR